MGEMALPLAIETVSKFRGCLVGALLGDCLGAPFEMENTVSRSILQRYFDKMEDPSFKSPQKRYTDDTAMTKSVAESLIHHPNFSEQDMAKRFLEEYIRDHRRGYGAAVGKVFNKWAGNLDEVWKPAKEQFEGHGSAGNGAAMRVAPVALLCHNDENKLIDFAIKSSQLTHTHRLGVHGAVLQALAVQQSFVHDPKEPIDINQFSSNLMEKMSKIEPTKEQVSTAEFESYQIQLEHVKKLLSKENVGEHEVEELIGNDVIALRSVPTAIYCFLRAQTPIENIQTDDIFRRTLQYSISLGGDTDTIASMAGAICGAYLGVDCINKLYQKHCEAVDEVIGLADELHKVTFN